MVNLIDAVTKNEAIQTAMDQLGMGAELSGVIHALTQPEDGTQIYIDGVDALTRHGRTDEDRRNILRGLVYKAALDYVQSPIHTHRPRRSAILAALTQRY